MGDEATKTTARGLLIPDPRVTFKDTYKPALSVVTEAGPRVGVPQATIDSDMILETAGSQSGGGDVRIVTQYSGHPKTKGGAFTWYNQSDTATLKHRGWEPPWTFTGLEEVKALAAGRQRAVNFDVLTTGNDTIVGAGIYPTTSGATSSDPWAILVWHKSPTAATWSEVTVCADANLNEGETIQSARIDGWSSNTSNNGPALLELPDGRLLCFFWVRIYSDADGKYWQIRSHISKDNGATWSLYQEYSLSTPLYEQYATQQEHFPGRLRAAYKDGQILLLATIREEIPSATPSGFVGTKIGRTILGQWASSSLGGSFDLVEKWDGTEAQSGGFFDVVTHTGQFVVVNVHDPDAQTIELRKIGSAFQKLSTATRIDVPETLGAGDRDGGSGGSSHAPNFLNRGELTLTKSPEGLLFLCFVRIGHLSNPLTKQNAEIIVSYDGGDTWEDVGGKWDSATTTDWDAGDGGFYSANYDLGTDGSGGSVDNQHIRDRLRHIAATWQRGRLVLLSSYDETDPSATAGDEQAGPITEQGVYALYLGGYSTLTLGSAVGTNRLERRANYRQHWLPFAHPELTGNAWTQTTAGTHSGTFAVDSNGQRYAQYSTGSGSGATGQRFYADANLARPTVRDTASSSSHTMRIHAEWACHVTSGGSIVNSGIGIKFRNGRPGAGEIFTIRLKADGTVTIWDDNGSAQRYTGTLSSAGLAYPAAFRMVTYDRKVALYAQNYRANSADRQWVKLYESANAELTEAAATGRHCEIEFGHLAAGGATTQNISRWYYVQAGAHNDATGPVCAVPHTNDWIGFTSPQDLGPRFYSGSALYVSDGVKLKAKDGPSAKGDTWKIQTRYDFGIENVHHEISASPARVWRSTGTAAEAQIRWDVDANAAAYTPGAALAVYLGNVNFRQCVLQGYDQSGAWVDLATIDTRQQVHFLRKGNTVSADTSGTTHRSPHFHTYNSLAGSRFVFNPAASSANPDPFPILSNTEGVFSNTATAAAVSKSPILRLDGDVSSMPANGVGEIWYKDVLTVVHVLAANSYQRFRIKIPTTIAGGSTLNGTYEGYWQIGTVIIGHLAIFGRQYAQGHIRQISPNADLQTQRGGTRRATRLGPARRSVEFAWADSIDVTQIQEANPAPDYFKIRTLATSDPVATVADTAWQMEGLISSLDGPVTPVVYVPAVSVVTTAGTTTETILDPNRMLYGRIVSDRYRIENVLGSEWADEVVTASAIRIDEEV